MARRTQAKANRRERKTHSELSVPAAGTTADTREHVLEAMAEVLTKQGPRSTAEALRSLRQAYPDHPLALRLAALAVAMRRPQYGSGDLPDGARLFS